jgi:hypothetical protein
MIPQSPFFAAFAARPRPADSGLLEETVGTEGAGLRALLAATGREDLSPQAIHKDVEGNLWMLTADAFRYFLPAFLDAGVEHYELLGNFVAELISALTEPTLEDIQKALDDLSQIPEGIGLAPDTLRDLRRQQLEWYNSGTPVKKFRARVDGLSAAEGAAILAFMEKIRDAHGEDFPFDEPQLAIDRHWASYSPGS